MQVYEPDTPLKRAEAVEKHFRRPGEAKKITIKTWRLDWEIAIRKIVKKVLGVRC